MGSQLVGMAHGPQWAELGDTAHRVLTYMALKAMDADTRSAYTGAVIPGRIYAKGHAPIVDAIQRRDQTREAASQSVTRSIRLLKQAGAIRLVTPARYGQPPIYEVTPEPQLPVDN